MKRPLLFALPLLAAALLPGCKSVEAPKVPGVTPYRMVIQQGNFISQEMVAQLKPGMTKEQVRFVLGTPLVTDIFHADRWDYVYFRELPDGKREQRNLSVVFEKDRLARVLGDLLPAEGAAARASGFDPLQKPEAAKPAAKPAAEAPKPAAEPAKTAVEPPKEAAKSASTVQNWSTANDKPPASPESGKPAAEAKSGDKQEGDGKAEEAKTADEPKERGFFGRMLEKIGL
jgi:outer membrane protein assembly factor BamE